MAPLKTADPIKMAGEAQDYEVTIQHTFIDGLINAITFGLYTPTTTTITKWKIRGGMLLIIFLLG